MPKKAELNSKTGKYVIARKAGLTKEQAKINAGYAPTTSSYDIEATEVHKQLQAKYADVLLNKITLEAIAEAHADNIIQDKDKGARNVAIKQAIDRIEPEATTSDNDNRVIVILKAD